MVMQFNFKQILNEMKYLVKLCPDIRDIPYALICPLSFIKLTQKDEKEIQISAQFQGEG